MRKFYSRTDSMFGWVVIGLFLLSIGGWIANIVKIVVTFNDALTGMFIARVIGVFMAPIGAVLGFL